MEMKPGYQHSEVGLIPEDWDAVLLDSVAKRGSGHTPDKAHPEYWGGSIKWVSLQDSERLDRHYIGDTAAKITPEGIAHSSARMHPKGTVVLSRDAGVGKSAIIADDMAVSQHFMAWTCGSSLNNHFLYYWLQSHKLEFERIAMGNTIKTIGLPYFRQLAVPLPKLTEQEAIAEALGDADALIESLEQLLAKKRLLKQGAMQELLTGKKRLPGFSGQWEMKRIGEFTDCTAGGTPATGVPQYWGGPIRWMNSGELNLKAVAEVEGRISEAGLLRSSTKLIPAKCVLIGLAGQGKTRGTVAMNLVSLCTNQSIAAIFPNPAFVSQYLYYNLDSRYDELRELSAGDGGRGGLNLTLLRQLTVPLPTPPEQTAIATVVPDMDEEIAALEEKLAKARQVKQGMMQELLTGRIRLPFDREMA